MASCDYPVNWPQHCSPQVWYPIVCQDQRAEIERLEGECDRLKVCGTCRNWEQDYYGYCRARTRDDGWAEEGGGAPDRATDPCQFTPSRWTPYWE